MEQTLSQQQVKSILDNAPQGMDRKLIVQKLVEKGYKLEGFNQPAVVTQQTEDTGLQKAVDIASDPLKTLVARPGVRAGQALGAGGLLLADKLTGGKVNEAILKRTGQTLVERLGEIAGRDVQTPGGMNIEGVQALGQGGGRQILGEAAQSASYLAPAGGVGAGLAKQTAIGVGTGYLADIGQKLPDEDKTLTEALTPGVGTAIGAVVPVGIRGAAKGATLAKQGVEAGLKAGKQISGDIATTGGEMLGTSKNKVIEFLSPEIDTKMKTVLQKTPTSKFNEVEDIAKKASESYDSPSAFEVIGNKLADSAEQINSQIKSLSQQKKAIISKAKNGLTDFKKETGNTILELNRALKDSSLAKNVISKLKTVNTKLDADNVIDDIQDMLYKGNKDMTIPLGSKEDKVLKSIIGKYNGKLKEGLPTAYQKLNNSISEKLTTLDDLNRALGETVEGVPIKGSGLVKQYFSPSGSKAKQLFEFIKKNTGYDAAQETVLAKYFSEIYKDPRTRSLLEGLPTTPTGIIDKAIDFTVEKTGLGGAVQEQIKKGSISKGRSLTY